VADTNQFLDANIKHLDSVRRGLVRNINNRAQQAVSHACVEDVTVNTVSVDHPVRAGIYQLISSYVDSTGIRQLSRPVGTTGTDQKGKNYTKLVPWAQIEQGLRSGIKDFYKAKAEIQRAKAILKHRLGDQEAPINYHLYNTVAALSEFHLARNKKDTTAAANLVLYHAARYKAHAAGGDYRVNLLKELALQVANLSDAVQDYGWKDQEIIELTPVGA
jgi:hypothetical protein